MNGNGSSGFSSIICPIFAQYSILVENRDSLSKELLKMNIPTTVHYPVPIHKQPVFKTNEFHLPLSEYISDRVLSLPMHPYLNTTDQQKIVDQCLNIISRKNGL